MVLNKRIPLYLKNEYPLWLTKDLIMYVGGKTIVDNVDWIKSDRNCLYIKKRIAFDMIKDMTFFTPMVSCLKLKITKISPIMTTTTIIICYH